MGKSVHTMTPDQLEHHAAAVPHLLGYQPVESVVVVPLTPERHQPPLLAIPFGDQAPTPERLARRLRPIAPTYARQQVLLFTFSRDPDNHLAHDAAELLQPRRVLADIHVDDNAWTSRDHTLSGHISHGTRARLAAEYAFAGQPISAQAMREFYETFAFQLPGLNKTTLEELAPQLSSTLADLIATAEEERWLTNALQTHGRIGQPLPDPIAVRVVVALQDRRHRDQLIINTLTLDTAPTYTATLNDLLRRTPDGYRTPVATTAAMAHWMSHDRLSARAALHQATDPHYTLAELIEHGLDAGLAPINPPIPKTISTGRTAEDRTLPAADLSTRPDHQLPR